LLNTTKARTSKQVKHQSPTIAVVHNTWLMFQSSRLRLWLFESVKVPYHLLPGYRTNGLPHCSFIVSWHRSFLIYFLRNNMSSWYREESPYRWSPVDFH